jgi:PhnB protein
MEIQPYLFFDGRCEEAIEFYRQSVGAEVTMLMRFKDSPEPADKEMCSGAAPDKVMHASLKIGESMVLCSDGQCQGKPSFQGFSLSIVAKDAAEAERLFTALGKGGQVQMPLAKTFWSPAFGMLADRFGVSWMVMAEH